jgi:hypothetical protein
VRATNTTKMTPEITVTMAFHGALLFALKDHEISRTDIMICVYIYIYIYIYMTLQQRSPSDDFFFIRDFISFMCVQSVC